MLTDTQRNQIRNTNMVIMETEQRRDKMLLVSVLVGLALVCKLGIAAISMVLGEFSITYLSAPLMALAFAHCVREWKSSKAQIAQLQESTKLDTSR